MEVIKPFDDYRGFGGAVSFFLGGGSTNWRDKIINTLQADEDSHHTVIINPMDDNYTPERNTAWEAKMIKRADCLVFWFPQESVCPISLFELALNLKDCTKSVIIGIDPKYPKFNCLIEQLDVYRPDLTLFFSLSEILTEMEDFVEDFNGGTTDTDSFLNTIKVGGTD